MKQYLNRILASISIVFSLMLCIAPAAAFASGAQDTSGNTSNTNNTSTLLSSAFGTDSSAKSAIICGANSAASGDCTKSPSGSLDSIVKTIINILSAIVGIAAIIMIIVAGLRYVTSAGSPEGTKAAKSTLIYVVIGLVIVALAQTITHFVLTEAANPSTSSSNSSNSSGSSNSPGVNSGHGIQGP